MASLWNKTLFYLGLVDEDEEQVAVEPIDETPQVLAQQPHPGEPSTGQVASKVRPPGAEVPGRRVEPPPASRRTMSEDRSHAEAGVYIHPSSSQQSVDAAARRLEPESQIIVARNFSDAQTLADSIKAGRNVVLDLRSAEPEMVRRIVDFASGLTYALDGKMSKTTQGVILVTPAGSSLGVGEQERLASLGLFAS